MTPLLLRYAATLAVVLAVSGLGGQVVGRKHSEENADVDADGADAEDQDQAVDIMALTTDTFQEQAESGLPLLVYYYAKWCKHCVTTWPMIEALAVVLRDRDDLALTVAKVDVEAETELAKDQGVSGFPTIRVYRDGRHNDFFGERSVPNLVRWLERKMGLAVHKPKSAKEARQLINAHPVAVVGFFMDVDSEEAAVFKATSAAVDKAVFVLVDDEELLAEFNAEDGAVVVFKKFDEGRVDMRLEHSVDSLAKALKHIMRPLVPEYRSDEAHEYFTATANGNRALLVAFLSRRAGHFELLHDTLQAVALESVSNVSFLAVNVDKADNAPVLSAFGVTNATAMPAVRMYTFASGHRYQPGTDRMSGDAVRDFIAGVQSGALQPVDAAQQAPEPEAVKAENGVTVLTSATFDQEVYDGRRHALVLFYTDSCKHCVTFKPIFEEVAGQVSGEPSLLVAKINMGKYKPRSTGVDIVGVPYVVMYPRCGKEKPVVFDGTRNAKTLLKFVKKHTGLEAQKARGAKGKAADAQREEL